MQVSKHEMIRLNLDGNDKAELKILCLGAHSDDIEIGCGGTILHLIKQYPRCKITWVVFSAIGERKVEAQHGADGFAGKERVERIDLKDFRDGFLPFVGAEVKGAFEELKQSIQPDLIFTHTRRDAHQDHRQLCELTWNTFRNHLILEYEIPKYDGDLGQPNLFVPLERDEYEKKVKKLMETFGTQRSKRWFDESTFLGLMRLRGMECNSESGYAEAFHCHKIVI